MSQNAAIFARELRRQCERRGSIAQVCIGTGINRQQFNKYLAGQVLPSFRNMQKICTYLGITAEQLMVGGGSGREPGSNDVEVAVDFGLAPPGFVPPPQSLLPATSGERPANALPLGSYDCYFPLHAESEMVVRWLVTLRMKQGLLTFTCRSNVRSMDSRRCGISSMVKYHGFVMSSPREATLIATSDVQLHQPSVITIGTLPVVGRTYFSGLAMTRRIDGPLAITAALRYRGYTLKARRALDGIGIVSLNDKDLDPVIVQLMRAVPPAGPNWMQSVNGKSLRTVSPSGGSGLLEARATRHSAG